MSKKISFSFVERLTSVEKMKVTEQGNLTVVVPDQCPLSRNPSYQSPYQLRFSFNWSELVAGFDQSPYSSWVFEANPNYFPDDTQWLDPNAYPVDSKEATAAGSLHWGPEPRHYPTLSFIKKIR
jgi:hypothetical protein